MYYLHELQSFIFPLVLLDPTANFDLVHNLHVALRNSPTALPPIGFTEKILTHMRPSQRYHNVAIMQLCKYKIQPKFPNFFSAACVY